MGPGAGGLGCCGAGRGAQLRVLPRSPECAIERPERLAAVLERLRERGLEQRCLGLQAREASEAELHLVHR